VQDVFIACVDGLKGFPEAIEAVYPHAAVQLCIVQMVRHSLNYVSWKMRKAVAADLKRIYASATADEAALVKENPTEVHVSSNRTCEVGLERATGEPYGSVIYLLEELTR